VWSEGPRPGAASTRMSETPGLPQSLPWSSTEKFDVSRLEVAAESRPHLLTRSSSRVPRMPLEPGTHSLGPENGTLSVNTKRSGAAAKAGHDLVIHVTSWKATLEVGEDLTQSRIELDADATSLRVREGTGGLKALGEDDKSSIQKTIDDDVLKRKGIEFRSTAIQPSDDGNLISVRGELTLVGTTRPIVFDVTVGGAGKLSGSAVVKQTDWGIKPYSALFGALKVADEVEVVLDASLTSS